MLGIQNHPISGDKLLKTYKLEENDDAQQDGGGSSPDETRPNKPILDLTMFEKNRERLSGAVALWPRLGGAVIRRKNFNPFPFF